jgi:hypothetical protein
MDARVQRMAVFATVVAMVVYFIAVAGVARLIPPPNPSAGPAQVAALYRDHQDRIRVGSLLMFLSAGFFNFFVAAISQQLKRMPGSGAQLLSRVQLASGLMATFMFLWGPMVWVAATFRPASRSPEILSTLHDLAWLSWVGVAAWIITQNISIAAAILTDRSKEAVYPRWLAYVCLWAAVLYLPAGIDIFFHSGVFAWNGLVVFWLPVIAYGAWFLPMVICTLWAIDNEAKEANAWQSSKTWSRSSRSRAGFSVN